VYDKLQFVAVKGDYDKLKLVEHKNQLLAVEVFIKLLLALETGHNNVPEQVAEVQAWLEAFAKGGKN